MQAFVAFTFFEVLWILQFTGSEAAGGRCPAERAEPWSYRGLNGPNFWGVTYPICNERQQSPINIETRTVVNDESLGKLKLSNYDQAVTKSKIENNGHTAQVEPQDLIERVFEVGQPGVNYTLRQFHFHWGDKYHRGSEHLINSQQYAMEMHLVHMNRADEIAVIGIFLQEQLANNPDLEPIVKSLANIKYKDNEAEINQVLNLNNLLPKNRSYYRYQGSLTTPSCNEGVTWTVFKDVVRIGSQQMKAFRRLKSVATKSPSNDMNCQLVNNFRPVQPLNGRTVYFST